MHINAKGTQKLSSMFIYSTYWEYGKDPTMQTNIYRKESFQDKHFCQISSAVCHEKTWKFQRKNPLSATQCLWGKSNTHHDLKYFTSTSRNHVCLCLTVMFKVSLVQLWACFYEVSSAPEPKCWNEYNFYRIFVDLNWNKCAAEKRKYLIPLRDYPPLQTKNDNLLTAIDCWKNTWWGRIVWQGIFLSTRRIKGTNSSRVIRIEA